MSTDPFVILRGEDHLGKDENHYPGSAELLSYGANFSDLIGLKRLGIWLDVLKPGRRSSWPHAHSHEEEFIYVVEGTPDVWADGEVRRLRPGDAVGFPPGTGVAHCFINNTDGLVKLLVVGERGAEGDQVHYPLHAARNMQAAEKGRHWDSAPTRALGPHDGLPDKIREG